MDTLQYIERIDRRLARLSGIVQQLQYDLRVISIAAVALSNLGGHEVAEMASAAEMLRQRCRPTKVGEA